MTTFFCIAMTLFLTVLPSLVWLVIWGIGLAFGRNIPFAPFGWAALALVVIFYSLLTYGYTMGRWKLHVSEIDFSHSEVPASFEGYRIVHISDLHLSTFDDSPHQLKRFVDTINSLSPDLICFTGDMVTIGRSEAESYTEVLQELSAKDGIVSVLGNHDFMIYNRHLNTPELRDQAVEDLAEYQRSELKWNLLRNSNITIQAKDSSKITIVGVDNLNVRGQGFRTINKGDLNQAMEGTEGFMILLTHDPTHWRAEVLPQTSVQLTLSGHTHRAQLQIFGWNASSLMFDESGGLYKEGEKALYVNSGLGCTVPFRIGADPEITVITLHTQTR